MIYGGPDTSHELSFEPCHQQGHRLQLLVQEVKELRGRERKVLQRPRRRRAPAERPAHALSTEQVFGISHDLHHTIGSNTCTLYLQSIEPD